MPKIRVYKRPPARTDAARRLDDRMPWIVEVPLAGRRLVRRFPTWRVALTYAFGTAAQATEAPHPYTQQTKG